MKKDVVQNAPVGCRTTGSSKKKNKIAALIKAASPMSLCCHLCVARGSEKVPANENLTLTVTGLVAAK